jgi:hypothetical protein
VTIALVKFPYFAGETRLRLTLYDRNDYMQSYIGSKLPHIWCRYQHMAGRDGSVKLFKKFRKFYGSGIFITVFRRSTIRP